MNVDHNWYLAVFGWFYHVCRLLIDFSCFLLSQLDVKFANYFIKFAITKQDGCPQYEDEGY